jgi:hypothetical protein
VQGRADLRTSGSSLACVSLLCLLPTVPTPYCPHSLLPSVPTAYCLLPLLPTPYCLLPTAYCLLPTAYSYSLPLLPTPTSYSLLSLLSLRCLAPRHCIYSWPCPPSPSASSGCRTHGLYADMSDMPSACLRKQHNFLSGLRPTTMIFHNKISPGGSAQQYFATTFLLVDHHNDISQQNLSWWLTPTIFHNKIV